MKIVGLKIENFKKIEFVNLELDSKMNIVSGNNGAGKTSLVEALMGAIGGKTELGKDPQRKIKKGADKAVIDVMLSDGKRTLNIKRTITGKDVYLKATTEDGSPVKQSDLDLIFNHTTINLMDLLHMKIKDQVEFIKRVGGIDTSVVEAAYKEKFSERTFLNKGLKEAQIKVKSFGDVEKEERVDPVEVIEQINQIAEHNNEVDLYLRSIETKENKKFGIDKDVEAIEKSIKESEQRTLTLKKELVDEKKNQKNIIADINNAKKGIKKKKDDSNYKLKLQDIEGINSRANNYDRFIAETDILSSAVIKVSYINADMTTLLKERDDLIKNSKLPFKNVSFDKDRGVIINDIPFDDMSSAEQIRIMSRIYIESNPGLKVIYIKDGSLLDRDTLQAISEMSELKDYQFLVEVVSEQDESIIMRDGAVLGGEVQEEDIREEI